MNWNIAIKYFPSYLNLYLIKKNNYHFHFSILAADMGCNQPAIAIHLHLQFNLNQLAIAIHLQPTCNPLAIAIHQQSIGNCEPLAIAIHLQSIANCNTLAIHSQLQSTGNPMPIATHWQSTANCNPLAIHWQLQPTGRPTATANQMQHTMCPHTQCKLRWIDRQMPPACKLPAIFTDVTNAMYSCIYQGTATVCAIKYVTCCRCGPHAILRSGPFVFAREHLAVCGL